MTKGYYIIREDYFCCSSPDLLVFKYLACAFKSIPVKWVHVIKTGCHFREANYSFWIDRGFCLRRVSKVTLRVELNIVGSVENAESDERSPYSTSPCGHSIGDYVRQTVWSERVGIIGKCKCWFWCSFARMVLFSGTRSSKKSIRLTFRI